MRPRSPAPLGWWYRGSGSPRREFLHVDDLADAAVMLMHRYDEGEIIDVSSGEDVSIGELAYMIADTVGYRGEIEFDASKPDGTPRKLLDVSRLRSMGWVPRIPLPEGIQQTYRWYTGHSANARQSRLLA